MERKSESRVKRNTGLTPAQFENLFHSLAMLQMRAGQSDEDIAAEFELSKMTIGRRLSVTRKVLEENFSMNYVNVLPSREFLIHNSTEMCRELFNSENEDKIFLVWDATYIYINKSRNYDFQKATYTKQKMRNFIKIMMCVTTNGYIVYALGPYEARDNDATIMRKIDENYNAFDVLDNGDTLILDRGFRDCVKYFEDKGFTVLMPSLVQKSDKKGQLTTIEANRTRLVTATRFIVETRNGHMKTVWRIFNTVWNSISIPHLVINFQICAALINKYYVCMEPNRGIATEIAERMLDRINLVNEVYNITKKSSFQKILKRFEEYTSYNELPSLSQLQLIWIALGKYQIRQAESYCARHIKKHGRFIAFKLPDSLCNSFFSSFHTDTCKPILLMLQLDSRFRSQKHYNTYVLLNINGNDENAILGYCCECYNGLRTVGCCSHTMTLIWYSMYAKNIVCPTPAGFLDHYFGEISDADDDSSEDET